MFPKETSILIVDDSKTMAKVIGHLLNQLNYDVITYAQDGEDALNKLAQAEISGQPIKLVVCDWRMPKMAGLELVKTMRSKEEWAKIPFIFLSAVSQQQDMDQALAAGADSFIIKPPELELLKTRLAEIYKKRNS